jgi:hypothetical protein
MVAGLGAVIEEMPVHSYDTLCYCCALHYGKMLLSTKACLMVLCGRLRLTREEQATA